MKTVATTKLILRKKARKPSSTEVDRLVGASEAQKSQEDAFLVALGNLAIQSDDPLKISGNNQRRSRFWFRLEPTAAEVVKVAKAKLKPPRKEHVDQAVVDRLKSYRKTVPSVVQGHLEQVREFFLTEIAPLTMASAGGASQSREVASRLLETEIDSAIFGRFENMVNRAATIKMGLFVLRYFDLPSDHFSSLLGLQNQTQQPIESEIKKILEQLNDASSRKDVKTLSNAVSSLRKDITNLAK